MRTRQGWKRTGALIGTAGIAAILGTGVLAAPASAHTPNWTVDCSKVTVDLTRYNGKVENTVTIKADGKDLLPAEKFGESFSKTLDIPAHSQEVKVELIVKAGDGDKFSRDETKVSPVCEGQESQSPSPSDTPSESAPAETPSEQPPSTTAPAHVPAAETTTPAEDNLAETGASSNTPIIAGVAGAVVVAGAALLLVTRKRRAARH